MSGWLDFLRMALGWLAGTAGGAPLPPPSATITGRVSAQGTITGRRGTGTITGRIGDG